MTKFSVEVELILEIEANNEQEAKDLAENMDIPENTILDCLEVTEVREIKG